MNLTDGLFAQPVYLLAHLVAVPLLGWTLHTAPWWKLQDAGNRTIYFASCVFLLIIWSLNAGIKPGLNYHLLGATVFVLMFGWQFALFGIAAVLVGTTLHSGLAWHSLSLNFLIMGVLPVLVSQWSYRFAVRWLPHNFFVYVLFNGYLTASVAMALSLGSAMLLLLCCGPYTFTQLKYDYLPYSFFLTFAEGFMSGMVITSLALFRPEWLSTFDDRRYLKGK